MGMCKPAATILATEGKGAGGLTAEHVDVNLILQFFSVLTPLKFRVSWVQPLSRINLQSFAGGWGVVVQS